MLRIVRREHDLDGALTIFTEDADFEAEVDTSPWSDDCWRGGPFEISMNLPPHISSDRVEIALQILDNFCSRCHHSCFIFYFAQFGKTHVLNHYSSVIEDAIHNNLNPLVFIGSNFPNNPQSPGRSAIANLRLADLISMMEPDREFEDLQAKMFITFIYNLWDDHFRVQIAESLSMTDKDCIQSDLMGDIRHIRHAIVHQNSVVEQDIVDQLKMLSQIWTIEAGKLLMTASMIHALMEQINAIRIKVVTRHDVAR